MQASGVLGNISLTKVTAPPIPLPPALAQPPDGLDVGATLTDKDKALVGWDPNASQTNPVADALASYRQSGAVTGEVSQAFVDSLRNAIVKTGAVPADPGQLTTSGPPQPGGGLSAETYAALNALLAANPDNASPSSGG